MPTSDTLQDTANWFEAAVPTPTAKNISTQLGVHVEEVNEMLTAFEILDDEVGAVLLMHARMSMMHLANFLKAENPVVSLEHNVDFLDSLCDQIVTATGVAHMFDMDIVGAMNEVNASNFSKFINGIPQFDSNLKITKGPDYFKPNLEPFVVRLPKE